jgi:hypothetical protein
MKRTQFSHAEGLRATALLKFDMTPADFRRLALALPSVEENEHMSHPDFRVGGKIFATLGYPDKRFATVMLSPQDQDLVIRDHPKAFIPASGAWGRAGSTSVLLRLAPRRAVAVALEAAWRRRAPKKLTAKS